MTVLLLMRLMLINIHLEKSDISAWMNINSFPQQIEVLQILLHAD
jgi:hypothetical protein